MSHIIVKNAGERVRYFFELFTSNNIEYSFVTFKRMQSIICNIFTNSPSYTGHVMSKYFQSGIKIFQRTHLNTQIPATISWINITFVKLSRPSVFRSLQTDSPRWHLRIPIMVPIPMAKLPNNEKLAN